MKDKINGLVMGVLVMGLSVWLASSTLAVTTTYEWLFSDDFTTSASSTDVNYGYDQNRQTTGTYTPRQYRQGSGAVDPAQAPIHGTLADETSNPGWTAVGNGSLQLSADGSSVMSSISPEHNFNQVPGVKKDLAISFVLDPVVGGDGVSSWAGVSLCAADNANFGTSGSGARGQSVQYGADQFSILFRDNGEFEAYSAGTEVGSGTYSASIGDTYNIDVRIYGLVDGNPWDGVNDARIDVFIVGNSVPLFTYIKSGGYSDNYITLIGESDSGNASSQFDDFAVKIVSTAVPYEVIVSPTDSSTNTTRTVKAVIIERASTFVQASLYLDGAKVVDESTRLGVTNTLSYVAHNLAVGNHTGKVIVAGATVAANLTNQWTFAVEPVMGEVNPTGTVSWNYNSNGDAYSTQGTDVSGVAPVAFWNDSVLDGRTVNLFDDSGALTPIDLAEHSPGTGGGSITGSHPGLDADGSHNREIMNGYLKGTTGTGGSGVTLSSIPYTNYNIYVYFSSDTASRTGSVTDGTTTYYYKTLGAASVTDPSGNALLVQATDTTTAGYSVAANYALFRNLSGETKTLTVNVDAGGGIAAIQIVGTIFSGPTVDPVIHSINVAGGMVNLSWTAEDAGIYSIWRKTALTDGSWSVVTNNLPSGNQSASVPASGADQEFFQVRGE